MTESEQQLAAVVSIDRPTRDPYARLNQLVEAVGYAQAYVAATCATGHDLTPPPVLLRAIDRMRLAIAALRDSLDVAWSVIANAGDGDWSRESDAWREAARRWQRDHYTGQNAEYLSDADLFQWLEVNRATLYSSGSLFTISVRHPTGGLAYGAGGSLRIAVQEAQRDLTRQLAGRPPAIAFPFVGHAPAGPNPDYASRPVTATEIQREREAQRLVPLPIVDDRTPAQRQEDGDA